MLGEVFYWVLNMSILGTLMGAVLLLLRKIRRIPRLCIYVLWTIPLLRFWLPFAFTGRYSLMNMIAMLTTKAVPLYQTPDGLPDLTMTNSVMAANSYFPIVYKTQALQTVFTVSGAVWCILFCTALLTAVLLYAFTKAETGSVRHIEGRIYASDKITAPAVYGIFHPKIILPEGLPKDRQSYILLHEKVHLKRCDNLFRCIAVITACLHWFNPFVWIFLRCFFEDMELACDNAVLKRLDTKKRKAYALTILEMTGKKSFFVSAFGGAKVKVRIQNVLSYKKITFFSGSCFCLLVLAVTGVLLTNAQL